MFPHKSFDISPLCIEWILRRFRCVHFFFFHFLESIAGREAMVVRKKRKERGGIRRVTTTDSTAVHVGTISYLLYMIW